MPGKTTYYVTTPIYYVNDSPHIGHAYTTLACDVLARFLRLDGVDVHFLTGTDEHGQKVEKAAADAGMAPKPFTDKVSENFRALGRLMNYSNDDFIRTTEERHIRASQAIWTALKRNGHIYLGAYEGWYAVRDEAFYGESELTLGTDGRRRAPSGAEVDWVSEPSYFFDLSKWQDKLLRFYADNPDFIAPETRRNEVVSFVRSGLQDLSISRTSFKWGVPVPDDPGHIIYVWIDALTNYATAVGYPDEASPMFTRYWPADLHMVGKDILRFHAVYWPAMLMGAGLAPPRRIFAHGWWTNEGQKISKSVGNVIDPHEIVATYGLDQVRYFLLREVPFGNDGDFSRRAMIHRINGDLANDLGNLVQRVISMLHQYCAGVLPAPGPLAAADQSLIGEAAGLLDALRGKIAAQAFHEALDAVWSVVRAANGYVDHQAPWKLREEDPARLATVLHSLCDVIRRLGLVLQPFMPDSAAKILDQVGVSAAARNFASFGAAGAVPAGTTLAKPTPIFPRHLEPGASPQAAKRKGPRA